MSAAFAHPAVIPSCFERLQTLSALSQVFPLFWRRTWGLCQPNNSRWLYMLSLSRSVANCHCAVNTKDIQGPRSHLVDTSTANGTATCANTHLFICFAVFVGRSNGISTSYSQLGSIPQVQDCKINQTMNFKQIWYLVTQMQPNFSHCGSKRHLTD